MIAPCSTILTTPDAGWAAPWSIGQQSIMETTKICRNCGKELPISRFVRNKSRKDGYGSYCLECNREKSYHSQGRRTAESVVVDRPKLDDKTIKELERYGLSDVPGRILILEMRRRGYRGELELHTIQKVVI